MATMNSAKNFALSPAGAALGLGDLVKQQLDDEDEQRKKKLAQQKDNPLAGSSAMQSFMQSLGRY